MKNMRKLLCVMRTLCMLPLFALAEAPVPLPGMIDEKAEIIVEGETNLTGCFYLSFPFCRNLIVLNGKGDVVW